MPQHGAHAGHRQAGERQEGLREVAHLGRQQPEDREHGERERPGERPGGKPALAGRSGRVDLEPRVALDECREDLPAHRALYPEAGRDLRVVEGGYGGGATPVESRQRGVVLDLGDPRDRGQGRVLSRAQGDALVQQVPQTAAAFRRIADDDPDFVRPTLDPLGLGAEECVPELVGETPGGQSGHETGFAQLDVVTPGSGSERVVDLPRGLEVQRGIPQLVHRSGDDLQIVVRQGVGDARREHVRAGHEVDPLRAPDLPQPVPPQPQEVQFIQWARRRSELDLHRGQVGPFRVVPGPHHRLPGQPLADEHRDGFELAAADRLIRGPGRPGELIRRRCGGPDRGSRGHGDFRRQAVGAQAGGERIEGNRLDDDEHQRQHHRRGHCGDHHERRAHGPGDGPHQLALNELVETAASPRLDFGQGRETPAPVSREMSGKDEERLDQREQQDQDDRDRHHPEHLSQRALEREQGREGHHGGESSHHHRPPDRPHPGNGGRRAAVSPLPLLGDGLAHHDRIVHHDAGHHEEGEHGENVEGEAEGVEQQERAHEGHGDTHRDPERHPQVEDQQQRDENEDGSEEPVAGHPGEPEVDDPGLVVPQRDVCTGRRGIAVEETLDLLRDLLRGLSGPRMNANEHGRPAVDPGGHLRFVEAVPDRRHVPGPDERAVRAGEQDDVPELVRGLAFREGADDHVARIRPHLAPGRVHGRPANAAHHSGDGESVPPQGLLTQLDLDLAVAHPGQGHEGHRGQREEVRPERLAGSAQPVLVEFRRGQRKGQDRPDHFGPHDFGLIGPRRREVLDALHRRPGGVQHVHGVREGLQFQRDLAPSLARGRDHALHADDAGDRLLDSCGDVRLDLRRGRAPEGHRNRDRARVVVRRALDGEPRRGEQAAAQEQQHEEVGGDVVPREPGDRSPGGVRTGSGGGHSPFALLVHGVHPGDLGSARLLGDPDGESGPRSDDPAHHDALTGIERFDQPAGFGPSERLWSDGLQGAPVHHPDVPPGLFGRLGKREDIRENRPSEADDGERAGAGKVAGVAAKRQEKSDEPALPIHHGRDPIHRRRELPSSGAYRGAAAGDRLEAGQFFL